mgnify:CR=1 FL=1
MDRHPNSPMKPFIASKFISNQETPVVCRNQKLVEIITANGRGGMSVIGYIGDSDSLHKWNRDGMFYTNGVSEWDLFFAPKNEVVHVYRHENDPNGYVTLHSSKDSGDILKSPVYTYLGTITGPIVPPEEGK